jgi:hypothetical protein
MLWRNTRFSEGGPFRRPEVDENHNSIILEFMETVNFIKYICILFNITCMDIFLGNVYTYLKEVPLDVMLLDHITGIIYSLMYFSFVVYLAYVYKNELPPGEIEFFNMNFVNMVI